MFHSRGSATANPEYPKLRLIWTILRRTAIVLALFVILQHVCPYAASMRTSLCFVFKSVA